jgi:hypothetical protein
MKIHQPSRIECIPGPFSVESRGKGDAAKEALWLCTPPEIIMPELKWRAAVFAHLTFMVHTANLLTNGALLLELVGAKGIRHYLAGAHADAQVLTTCDCVIEKVDTHSTSLVLTDADHTADQGDCPRVES